MLAKSFPKVSLESRLSRESYNAKFGMDECARKNYRVTLREMFGKRFMDLLAGILVLKSANF